MKLIHCRKDGCDKVVPETVYLNKWKALGFKILEDTSIGVSSIDLPEDKPQEDFDNMEWHELKKYASQKGINTYKKGRDEIIQSLTELEG